MSSFSQRLGVSQRQVTGQTLSPQMQRAMHLLHLSSDELEREIAEICETNPLIAERPEWSRNKSRAQDITDWSARVSAPTNLADHLGSQVALSRAPAIVKATAYRIIEHIAPNGRISLDDWETLATAPRADAALSLVQTLDPAGVGARSLTECFALQLDDERSDCPDWRTLLANLDALATEQAFVVATRCRLSEPTLLSMIEHLRTLDPNPGHRFEAVERIEIAPDLRVTRMPCGDWEVGLTWDPSASLRAEPAYRGWQRDPGMPAAAKSFLGAKQEEADWLRGALKQRGQTLLRVARLAIAYQDRFLVDGPEHLAPLTMRDVAAKLDLHESTVSRAVAHKFILTPRGVLALRTFFSTVVGEQIENREISSSAMRARIEKMIADETRPGQMSDEAISQALGQFGVKIARRSVAKHRELIGIGCARERARLASFAAASD